MSAAQPIDGNYGTRYNADAVEAAIKRDPRIKGKEARLIHALLKGRGA